MKSINYDFVVTRSPLRISFIGGGTDFPNYFKKNGGVFVSTTINRYIYCTVKKHSQSFKESIRLNYSKNEFVNDLDKIQNQIIRESLIRFSKDFFQPKNLYIGTIGDMRSNSGLGSSSAFSCALDLALLQFTRGNLIEPLELARRACSLELEILKKPIGIQDQFASAYGGLRKYEISRNGEVQASSIELTEPQAEALNKCLLLVDTGLVRNAEEMTKTYSNPNKNQEELMNKILTMAKEFSSKLPQTPPIDIPELLGSMLTNSWESKRKLDRSISSHKIDRLYEHLMNLGCLGGKVVGAGGGGYLLMVVPPNKIERILQSLKKSNILFDNPRISTSGSEVLVKA